MVCELLQKLDITIVHRQNLDEWIWKFDEKIGYTMIFASSLLQITWLRRR